jgi:hypothetical protein
MCLEIPVYLDEQNETAITGTPTSSELAIESSTVPVAASASTGCISHPVSTAADLVASSGCSVPAISLVTVDDASCQVASSTNSMDDDDNEELLAVAKHGVKRRWSFEENTVFKRSFKDALLQKKMPS